MSDESQVFWAITKKELGGIRTVRISPLFDSQLEAFQWGDNAGCDFSSQLYELVPLEVHLTIGTVQLNFKSEDE